MCVFELELELELELEQHQHQQTLGLYQFLLTVQHAWSPSGGWFFTPKNYKANTLVITAGLVGVSLLAYAYGEKVGVQANTSIDDDTIAKWNSAAKKARESSAVSKVHGE